MGPLQDLSIIIIQALQTFSPTLDAVMEFFTFLGRVEFYFLLIAFIYWIVDSKLGFRVSMILLSTDIVTTSFKTLLHQPRPYWVADGQVSMERETYGYSGEGGKAAEQFWGQSRRFFVPAYQAPLEGLLKDAKGMLLNPPDLKPGPATPFEAVTLYRDDVLAAAEFIVIAIEAGREDKIKSIDFELELPKPVLWILP